MAIVSVRAMLLKLVQKYVAVKSAQPLRIPLLSSQQLKMKISGYMLMIAKEEKSLFYGFKHLKRPLVGPVAAFVPVRLISFPGKLIVTGAFRLGYLSSEVSSLWPTSPS